MTSGANGIPLNSSDLISYRGDGALANSVTGAMKKGRMSLTIRATLEGILFGLLSISEILIPYKKDREQIIIMASGGFAKNDV